MRTCLLCVWCLGMAMLVALPVAAQQEQDLAPYIEDHGNGTLDWQEGRIIGMGVGTPPSGATSLAQSRAMAVRAATVVARRNLLEILMGVQIDSTTTIENYMVRDDAVEAQVRGHLQNSQVIDTVYLQDGSVEVTVGIALRGGFADVVIPRTTLFDTSPPIRVDPLPEPLPDPGASNADMVEPLPAGAAGLRSGLVVDARGLDARPAMTPRILDQDGREVYGSSFVSRDYAVQQGMAGYARDPQAAAANDRVSGNPLVVQAVDVSGEARTDIVISNADAERLRQAASVSNFLEQCRVMIVLD
ncbi:MAG: hypothetical protein D6E12_01040 [Desulfovibrio sp.]|nr:MAG: hypothetical protein D6E12_01040 [Desulfovibrio sp.]